MNAAEQYLDFIAERLVELRKDLEPIRRAARVVYNALRSGGFLYTFGTGHSHLLAEEIFYRAGGLARVKPILIPALMLHVSATGSTEAERKDGLCREIADEYGFAAGDVLLIASNSGRNAAAVGLAFEAKARRTTVIALTSLAHSKSEPSRHPSGQRLFELADVVLDNLGVPGDACLTISGQTVSPTSTVMGACILQVVVAEVTALGDADKCPVETFSSSNIGGGDDRNALILDRYLGRINSL